MSEGLNEFTPSACAPNLSEDMVISAIIEEVEANFHRLEALCSYVGLDDIASRIKAVRLEIKERR